MESDPIDFPVNSRRVILFDLDGTLVDSIGLIVASARHAFASRPGPAPDEGTFLAGIGRPLAAQFGPYAGSDDELALLIARYREYQLTHHDRLTTAYAGIPDALETLHAAGHVMGVVTSKIDALARRALTLVGLEHYFGVVVGLEATARHKPDPEPVLAALGRLGSSPENAMFVGDSPYDMEAGRRAGVTAVGVTWGPYPRQVLELAGAHHVLDHPVELPGYVRQLTTDAPS